MFSTLGAEATANPLRNVDGSGLPDSSDDRDALADEWADVIDANAFSRDAAWGSARKAVKEGSAGYSPPKGALLGCVEISLARLLVLLTSTKTREHPTSPSIRSKSRFDVCF